MSEDKNKAEKNDDVNTQPVVKPKENLKSGDDVLDPMTLRDSDTSKLKKIKPKSSTQTISLDSENIWYFLSTEGKSRSLIFRW